MTTNKKKIKKLTPEQQLNLCELLSLAYHNGALTHSRAEEIIDQIYCVAHLNGTCQNEHLNWHEIGHKLGKSFIKYGIGNYNKRRQKNERENMG